MTHLLRAFRALAPAASSGAEGFEARYRADIEKYARLIREAGIQPEN